MPFSDYFSTPLSYRKRQLLATLPRRDQYALSTTNALQLLVQDVSASSSRPDFGHLTLLVFEAVLEVVCVSAPGYIVARTGMFDAEAQKMIANLNVMLFTPALVFTKLASQLSAEKMADLAIIPVIFIVQTIISFCCSFLISKFMRLKKRQANFIIAMGVFGNSNSLPMSLVISLSKTLSGLHWDKVPGDDDDEVAARGILYLLIFQQLGQLVRWTWGYNVLLAPADRYTEEQGGTGQASSMERGRGEYRDEPETEQQRLLSPFASEEGSSGDFDDEATRVGDSPNVTSSGLLATPKGPLSRTPSAGSHLDETLATPANGNVAPHAASFRKDASQRDIDDEEGRGSGALAKITRPFKNAARATKNGLRRSASAAFGALPGPLQTGLGKTGSFVARFFLGLWEFMNPPLWAMLIAIIVASVPQLQDLFFHDGGFVRNSVTRAIEQSGGVAVPLILVVLGGNLARNTLPRADSPGEITDPKEERKLLIAALVSRMLIPTVLMAPLLALSAKYIPVSILDDKIFIIVCFLLTGAPTALQLAQICQINNVYMSVMSSVLFQSYVIWILPSTLILVLLALETVDFAER